jgi:hypothetical protein
MGAAASVMAGPVLSPDAVRPTIVIGYSFVETGLVSRTVEGSVNLGSQAVYDERTGTFVFNAPVEVANVFRIDNLSVGTNPDPFVEYSFGIKNFAGSTADYVFSFLSPYVAGPYTQLQSSHASTVTDGAPANGSVVVNSFGGGWVHRPEIDGSPAPGSFGGGCSAAGPSGFSVACNPFDTGFFGVSTAASGTFGVKVGFSLSGGDLYSTAGRVELSQIPEPGTWALLLAGLGSILAIGRRRLA